MQSMRFLFLSFSVLLPIVDLFCEIFPISFSISETKMVKEIPAKTQDFAVVKPTVGYIYQNEKDYYEDYQRSYFGITYKKGGWDCLRHYEILANGCIPYFVDLEKCDPQTMFFLPKELILEAMNLPGVSYLQIDHSKFDKKRYFEILNQLLDHTRKYLTSRKMAQYVVSKAFYLGQGKILFIGGGQDADYLRCCTLIGLKELYGDKVVDIEKVEHIYKSNGDFSRRYGRGFTYTKIVDDLPVNREKIEERIKNREFEIVIYGSIHRSSDYHDLVTKYYPPENIVYLCGEDRHQCDRMKQFHPASPFFLREFEGN